MRNAALLVLVGFLFVVSQNTFAIPAFSRQYGTSCTTCHIDFPKLNDFGKAFKDAGFKFPKNDEDFIKVPPVMLGAPAQKEMFPHTIWPGTIPGMPQIGLRFNTFFQVYSKNANNFNAGTTGPYIPRTDFQPGLFSIFTAGNFGDGIAFWVDDDISVGGLNANGELGDGYLKFVNLGRLFKLPTDSLSLRIGQFEIDLPFSQARTWNLSGWDIYDQANFGAANGLPGVANTFAFSSAGQGVEISGGHNYGGYHYSLAILNQNTSGTTNPAPNVSPEVGIFSDSNFKDIYGRVQYRFNLEQDTTSRNDVQAAGPNGPRDHTYLQLGTYYFYGRSAQHVTAENGVLTAQEPFYRTGGDFSFNYRTFNFFGLYMYGHDKDLFYNSTGTGFVNGSPAHFSGGFLETDYLALPWLMAIMRYDRVQSEADLYNAEVGGSTNYFSPASSTRNRISPGIQFLIHANIKASFEYQVRPQQRIYDGAGNALSNPFRTNQAIAGLEWVY
ncbi:MAG: hypothetical protein WBQ72_16910 [Terriglobales bacterium]|jgi:hypothetical protein